MAQILSGGIGDLLANFIEVRKRTLSLFKPLKIEDAVIQPNVFGSPPNWHLAHVTWFYQKILQKHGEEIHSDANVNLEYLNSYYQQFGKILPKSERGKFPRPTVEETLKYRSFIEEKVISFLKRAEDSSTVVSDELKYDIMLANQHEMQHQELMIYDFQYYFQRFPDPEDNYKPTNMTTITTTPSIGAAAAASGAVYKKLTGDCSQVGAVTEKPRGMAEIPGGLYELGFNGGNDLFCYDNELPEHKVYLQPFKIDIAPVSNAEYIKFIEDNGYDDFSFWLADGWDLAIEEKWRAPLYWERKGDVWMKKDFRGFREIELDEPVTNLSYYEAAAYANWAGKRLPTEAEWEKAASWNEDLQKKTLYPWGNDEFTPKHANLLESSLWGPSKIGSYPAGKSYYGCHQMIGDVWEWTSSEYTLYPGFKSKLSEYTDKWAINQKVLRGGSFSTPYKQIRNSYRNYFKPHERILFSGFRCVSES
ncbi:MAG TPA: ergothioneine biosynthesis protein EgtB [Nitrososphaeraceae archaeon]